MTLHIATHTAAQGQWLTPLRHHWSISACQALHTHTQVVRVVVAAQRGSTPREVGACLLVTSDAVLGTIGGGHLEHLALQHARRMLADGHAAAVQVQRLILGKELAQCCGGVVHLWLERLTQQELPLLQALASCNDLHDLSLLTRNDGEHVTRQLLSNTSPEYRTLTAAEAPGNTRLLSTTPEQLLETIHGTRAELWLYGAGHVGQALIRVLADLPVHITWVDARAEFLPMTLPDNVQPACTDPLIAVRQAPPQAHHRILTHDHALDYALCLEILRRDQFASAGVIGSRSKGARFRAQLRRDAVPATVIARLHCPIGVGINSKLPAAIAVSIAAQLLQDIDPPRPETSFVSATCGAIACAVCLTPEAQT